MASPALTLSARNARGAKDMTEKIYFSAMQSTVAGALSLGRSHCRRKRTRRRRTHRSRTPALQGVDQIQFHASATLSSRHFNCSALDTQAGDSEGAAEELKKAIALNADFIPAYINLGGILERSGAPEQALETWKTAANRPRPVTGNATVYAVTALKQIARVFNDHQLIEASGSGGARIPQHRPAPDPRITEQYLALRLAQCKWPAVPNLGSGWIAKRCSRAFTRFRPRSTPTIPLYQLAVADHHIRRAVYEGALQRPPIAATRRWRPADGACASATSPRTCAITRRATSSSRCSSFTTSARSRPSPITAAKLRRRHGEPRHRAL